MITKNVQTRIKKEVEDALFEAFNLAVANQANENDFILFTEHFHVLSEEEQKLTEGDKYALGQGFEGYNDIDRYEFFVNYMNIPNEASYDKANPKEKIEIRKFSRLTFPITIYFSLGQ